MPIAYVVATPTTYDFITKEDRHDHGLTFKGYGFALWKVEGAAQPLKDWIIRSQGNALTKVQAQQYLDQHTHNMKKLDGAPVHITLD